MSKAPWMLGIHGRVRTTTTDPDMGLISASDAGVWTANVLMFDMYGDIVDDPNFAITGTTYPKNAPDAPMMYLNEASVTAGGYTVTTDCHDVETCLRWIDYWYSEEGTFLANYGLEGVSFAYDENGNTPVSALEDMAGNLTAMKIDEAIALMQAAYDRYMSKAA